MKNGRLMDEKWQWMTYQLRQIGWQGQVSAILLLMAVVFAVIAQANQQQVTAVKRDVEAIRHQSPLAVQTTPLKQDKAAGFYAQLPSQHESNQRIAAVLQSADSHELKLDRTAYSTRVIPQSKMMLYQIQLPVSGAYTQIRNFINDVMNKQPSLALSEINFNRNAIDDLVVKANIEFVLYTKVVR